MATCDSRGGEESEDAKRKEGGTLPAVVLPVEWDYNNNRSNKASTPRKVKQRPHGTVGLQL